MNGFDIAWLAGVLEGEGSFFSRRNAVPVISVQMTDVDVIDRIGRTFGGYYTLKPNKCRPGRKSVYRVCANGARAAAWMMVLWTYMGERRRRRITGLLKAWWARTDKRFGPITPERRAACAAGKLKAWREKPGQRERDSAGKFL